MFKVKCKVIMIIESDTKVKNIFLKIYPLFDLRGYSQGDHRISRENPKPLEFF